MDEPYLISKYYYVRLFLKIKTDKVKTSQRNKDQVIFMHRSAVHSYL